MRIWVDPDKMVGLNLTASDVTAAVTAQNAQVACRLASASLPSPIQPAGHGHRSWSSGQLTSPDEFGRDRAARQSATARLVRLRDVARIEVGGAGLFQFGTRLNGKPTAGHRRAAGADRQRAWRRPSAVRRPG